MMLVPELAKHNPNILAEQENRLKRGDVVTPSFTHPGFLGLRMGLVNQVVFCSIQREGLVGAGKECEGVGLFYKQ